MEATSFAEKLRKLRKEKKLTQRELAEKLNISYTTAKNLETKEAAALALRTETTKELLQFFDCDFEYLFGEQEQPRKDVSSAATITGLSYETIENILEITRLPSDRLVLDLFLSNSDLKEAMANIFVAIAEQRPLSCYLSNGASDLQDNEKFDALADIIDSCSNKYSVIPRVDCALMYKQESIELLTEIVNDVVENGHTEKMDAVLNRLSKTVLSLRVEKRIRKPK